MNQQVKSKEQTGNPLKINTRLPMASSAVFLGVLGIAASFLPREVGGFFNLTIGEPGVIFMKITGALYLGFAVLNWMARGNIIGGIYSRPVALGNFFHFVLIAIVLLKYLITHPITTTTATGTIIYSTFALSFGYILFAGGKSCG